MAEWRHTTIGDVITLQRGFDITRASQRAGAVPVVSSGGISSYHDTAMSSAPGVVMGRKGTLGKVFYLNVDYWPHDTTLWVRDFKGNNPRFVYYFLHTLDFLSMNVGSSNPTLNRNHVHPVAISWPPLADQQAIGEVLGVLDDKIEANERIAETALHLARALYEETSLGDGESAELGELIMLKYGKALREPDRRPGQVPVYGCTGQVGWHDSSLTSSAGPVVGRKGANAGWISWAPRSCWVIDTAFYVEALRDYISSELAFLILESARLPSLVGDSAVPGLNRDAAHRHPVRIPSRLAAPHLSERIRPLIRRSTQAQDESRTLAALRDTLLPQLMSGKLRVRDAEKIVEDAV